MEPDGVRDPQEEGAASGEHRREEAQADGPTTLRERVRAWPETRRQGAATVLCALFVLLGWLAESQGLAQTTYATLYLLGYVTGGYHSARKGLLSLSEGELDVDLLMVLAAAAAASIGFWVDGAVLIFIFALSGTLEAYALGKTRRDVRQLMELRPEEALVRRDGVEQRIPVSEVRPGDRVIVRPGERIPVDGQIVQGSSSIDQAAITGESIPVDRGPGDPVYAGTINIDGSLEVDAERPASDTLLARIIRMVEEAKSERPPTQLFIERFESRYSKAVVAGALLFATLPPFLFGWSWSETIYRAIIFMVVASPCAVVLSTMPAVLSAISNGARHGILFKGGAHVENIGQIDAIVYDKTGTLTTGEPQVTAVATFGGMDRGEALRLAAAVEQRSDHPLAQAIVAEAIGQGLAIPTPDAVTATAGMGVRGQTAGRAISIGSRELLADEGIEVGPDVLEQVEALRRDGKTVAVMAVDRRVAALFGLEDRLRPQAAEVISELRRLGIRRQIMLTGDHQQAAEAVARRLELDEVRADLLPDEKVAAVKKLQAEYGRVAMVGDGVNDAPALATASVGVAMGGAGSDVALETSDVVLMSDDLGRLPHALGLGRACNRIVRQNLTFAVSVILVLVATTVIGWMTLPLGVLGHEGSTLLVALNGLRLLTYR